MIAGKVVSTAPPLRALRYAQANRPRFVAELGAFVRFPSVSAQPKHAADVARCADWLAGHLRRIGMEGVTTVRTPRHPIVYAAWRHRPDRPTVLIYGHYDVQPADPLSEWTSPPFAPTLRGNDLYGRGTSDDKGQMFVHVKALEAYLQSVGALPVNVVCLFEGEEEIGSPNLAAFLDAHRRALAADVAVVSDMPILAPDRPAITYAMRGGLGLELEACGPSHDLHSGLFGGAIANPLQALCQVIAGLHDREGHVTLPGFYDRVRAWGVAERAAMARSGPCDADLLRDAGATQSVGEPEYSLYERVTLRPSLTVNGIVGGYSGPGGKAVLPSRALAKLSFRLVLDQTPQEIARLFRLHIARIALPGIQLSVRTHLMAQSALVDRDHPAIRAAVRAYRNGFGVTPVFIRSGGTIPVVSLLQERLRTRTVLMGFALPDDRMHAPNEKFHLPNFYNGIATSLWFLAAIGGSDGYHAHDY